MRLPLLIWPVLFGGCSLVYDFDSFEPVSDAGLPDVNPANLRLDRVLSDPVSEGATGVVLIEGDNILADAEVRLTGMGMEGALVASTTSTDRTMIAFELAAPVDPELAAGESATIEVEVTQTGASETIDATVGGLDELVASSFGDPADAVTALAAGDQFSTITIDRALDLVGASPFHLRATASISIEQPLRANGRSAIDGDRKTRRAGGCPGGDAASTGGCGQAGGGAGLSGGGGGGGGSQVAGTAGGSSGANGGLATASPMLVPLADHSGRGGGGANGVVGGDGGGLIALTASRVSIAAAIEVTGGGGENSGGLVGCGSAGGPGGGGGAGGAILLRGRASIEVTGDDVLSLAGGAGGDGTAIGGGDCAGGGGSVGRLRIDTPALTGDPAAFVTEGDVAPAIGASIAPQSLVRSGASTQTIELAGDTANSPITFISVNEQVDSFSFETARSVELVAGVNEVCVHVTDPANGQPEESRHCVDIVYLP